MWSLGDGPSGQWARESLLGTGGWGGPCMRVLGPPNKAPSKRDERLKQQTWFSQSGGQKPKVRVSAEVCGVGRGQKPGVKQAARLSVTGLGSCWCSDGTGQRGHRSPGTARPPRSPGPRVMPGGSTMSEYCPALPTAGAAGDHLCQAPGWEGSRWPSCHSSQLPLQPGTSHFLYHNESFLSEGRSAYTGPEGAAERRVL